MPFVWNQSIAAGTAVTKNQLEEVKTNANSTASQIGISQWSWTTDFNNGLAQNQPIKASLHTETRNAIDYLHDNRTCPTHYISNLSSNNGTINTNHNGTVYSGQCSNVNSGVLGAYNGGVNGHNSTVYSGQNSSYNGTVNSSVNSTQYSGVNTSQNTTYYSLVNLGINNGVNTTVNGTNRIAGSDERLKDFYGIIQNPIQKILSLNGYYYKENKFASQFGLNNPNMQVGVSAQELEKVLPEAVFAKAIAEEYFAVDYSRIVVLLIEGMKEQQKEIEELKNKVNLLEQGGN